MAQVTIHCGEWSRTIQSDDKYFKTLLSSYIESTGDTPSDLRFDGWSWLPTQWEHWMRLRRRIDNGIVEVVWHADVEVIVSAMIDVPEGWERYTIIDERVDREKRLRIYESIGKYIQSYKPTSLTLDNLLQSLHYYTSVSPLDETYSHLTAGFTSNAQSLAKERDLPVWQAVIWSDLREFYEEQFLPIMSSIPLDSSNTLLRDTLHTTRYFIMGRVGMIDSIFYSPTTLSLGYAKFDRVRLYKQNMDAYIATESMAWSHLRIGLDPLLTFHGEPTRVDCYALSVHWFITADARSRVEPLTNLKPSDEEGQLTWGRITAILLLWALGRKVVKQILAMSKRRNFHNKTFKCGLIEVLERYQDDEGISLDAISTKTLGMYNDQVKQMLEEYKTIM